MDSVLGVTSSVRRGVQNSGRGMRGDGDCGMIMAFYKAREENRGEDDPLAYIYTNIQKDRESLRRVVKCCMSFPVCYAVHFPGTGSSFLVPVGHRMSPAPR